MTIVDPAAILTAARSSDSLVHCLTNPVTMEFVANAILAVGCHPIMASAPDEVDEVASRADALLINLGVLDFASDTVPLTAARRAAARGIPVVLDLVGTAASAARQRLALRLLECGAPTLLKGNATELRALVDSGARTGSVDARPEDMAGIEDVVWALSEQWGLTTVATGKIDWASDGTELWSISGGSPLMARITGTGCVAGALMACLAPTAPSPLAAACTTCALWGFCGQEAEAAGPGVGSFRIALLDELSLLSPDRLALTARMEVHR